MSVAEKLKALAAREQWRSHDPTVLAGLALTVEEALPQIVALVKAAEQTESLLDMSTDEEIWAQGRVLLGALTALDEALP